MPNKPLEQLEQFAIDVILERRYGKRAALLRWLLRGLSFLYAGIMRMRWWFYSKRLMRWHSLGCRVISIGNLTVGGTGKTPFVEAFARVLSRSGRRVAILSRGYKSVPRPLWQRLWHKLRGVAQPPRIVTDGRSILLDSEKSGDEPFMLATNLDNVVILTDKNRVKSGMFAIEQFGADVLLLDDGYQYLSLKERLNIVLIDRTAPFGNEHILPRGTLREPKDHLKRGDVIFITKCDGRDLGTLKKQIRKYNSHAEILECRHNPRYLQNLVTGERIQLDYLLGRKVGAVAGIAVPESFDSGLRKLGAELIYSRHYADHHRFTQQEIINCVQRTRKRGGHALITTEKDAVRFPRVDFHDLPVYYLRVEIELLCEDENFEEAIFRICQNDFGNLTRDPNHPPGALQCPYRPAKNLHLA